MKLPGIVQFRKCTLSDKELAEAVADGLNKMYKEPVSVPPRHIPARPDEDFDLLVGEMVLRFMEYSKLKKVKIFKVMMDHAAMPGLKSETAYISEEGALILWEAYMKANPNATQTMEQRNARGGLCWLSEITAWKKEGHLADDFELDKYLIQ